MTFQGICGHRGAGCTDSLHARTRGDTTPRPAENTVPSVLLAFEQGASFVEIDAVQTKDGRIVVVHSDLLSDHVFYDCGAEKISDLTLDQIKNLRVAPDKSGTIPTLEELLSAIKHTENFMEKDGVVINIELKDKKGTGGRKEELHVVNFHDAVLDALSKTGFPLHRVIFSSFATYDLIEMRKRSKDCLLAQLFDVPTKEEREVYPGQDIHDARYLMFTPANVAYAIEKAGITYAHPAIDSLDDANTTACAKQKITVNTWALNETSPAKDARQVEKALKLAQKHKLELGIITDYVEETKRTVARACDKDFRSTSATSPGSRSSSSKGP